MYVDGLKGQSDDVKRGGGIEMLMMRLRRKEGYGKSGSKEVAQQPNKEILKIKKNKLF